MEVKLQSSEAILDADMKSMLHLCESPSDVQFAKECLLRYFVKVEIPEFNFGPVFLRLCYEYDLLDTAFELMMDKSYRGAFSDPTSFNILLEILHQHKQYEKGLEALLEMKTQRVAFNKYTYLMAFAICYELNSPQSLETAMSVLGEASMNRVALSRLSLCFIVSLAIKQGEYKKALHALQKIERKHHSLCCNLSVLIASGMEYPEKVLQILEAAISPQKYEFLKKLELSQEVMDVLEEKLKATDLFESFNNIYEQLKQSGQISTLTVHEMLYASIQEQENIRKNKISVPIV
ncbi:pentatricopeptide repeat-containing protein 2, mitochondrial isoform X2 [Hyperolius riggenbachi]